MMDEACDAIGKTKDDKNRLGESRKLDRGRSYNFLKDFRMLGVSKRGLCDLEWNKC